MSEPRTPSGEKTSDDRRIYENKPAELPNYAQDTLKEVLGWYGLGEGGEGGELKNQQHPPSNGGLSQESRSAEHNNPLDLTNGHSQDGTGGVVRSNVSLSGHRKLIGMRFLFPPLSEEMSLFDKAKIWVARHDYKYFVGWTEEELQKVDAILRPVAPVSPELYKLHMNRSEYCRNVKLKYCLESDTAWAKEFQEKLRKPVSEGGFTGLCQAKIAAAEQWRKHSENYRSHQARYPNPKSKSRSPRQQELGEPGEASHHRSEAASREEGFDDSENNSPSEGKRSKFDEDDELYEEAEGAAHDRDDASFGSSLQGTEGLNAESEGEESGLGDSHGSLTGQQLGNKLDYIQTSKPPPTVSATPSQTPSESEHVAPRETEPVARQPRELKLPKGMSIKEEKDSSGMMMNPALQFYPLPMPLYPGAVPPLLGAATGADMTYSPSSYAYSSSGLGADPGGQYRQSKHGEKPSEYKRSERGLSFLFPSLSDHNLSLLDKVKITVIRHKNNYFLGWSEDELKNIDPLIRPKMVVSPEIYKEYCHRNAMKYDSNLQFAMESPEQWAKEFRAKLSRPPSEGGFSSLCEVKLEAGRLWREYSGKYRMHNIVKWQMDMNSATKTSKKHKLDVADREVKEEPPEKTDTSPGVISPSLPSPSAGSGPHAASGQAEYGNGNSREESRRTRQKAQRSRSVSAKTSQCASPFTDGITMGEDAANKVPQMMDPLSLSLGAAMSARALEQSALMGPRYYIPHPDMDIPSYLQSMAAKHAENSSMHAVLAMNRTGAELHADLARRLEGKDKPGFGFTAADFTTPQETLFKPLPKFLSVADQVYVWLERHKHNYFLGHNQDQLAMLGEFLRPNVPVTEEVFKKYVPESMIDVLQKIQYMIISGEPPAKHFQERLHKPAREGGFATFEEALTEAVVLWSSMTHAREVLAQQMKYSLQQQSRDSPSKPNPDDMNNNSPTVQSPNPTLSDKQSQRSDASTSAQLADNTADNVEMNLSPSHSLENIDNDVKDYRTERTLRKSQGLPSPDGASSSIEMEEDGGTRESSPDLSGGSSLWKYRDFLQAVCEDDASKSWHSRLTPYIAVLKANLGGEYRAPSTNVGCAVDMLLATLHLKQRPKSE